MEKKRICKFCKREFNRSPNGMIENPFCPDCYEERLEHVYSDNKDNSDLIVTDLGNGYINFKWKRK